MKRTLLLLSLVVTLACGGCGLDKEKGILMAAGSYGDLAVVVSDPELRPVADRFVAQLVTEKTFVIKPEPIFNVDIFEPDRWELAQGYKNVLILVALGRGGGAEKGARGAISKDTWARLEQGGGGVVQAKDPWATYQHLVVAASRDRNNLSSILSRNVDKIRDIYENSNRERILRRNRYDGLNTQLVNACMDQLGFFLEIPGEYQQNQLRPDGFPGVEMLRKGPSRGITVSWTASEDPVAALADRGKLAGMRAEMGAKMHFEEILPETFVWEEIEMDGKPFLKLEGAWSSTRFEGGGAFWSYFVAAPDQNRVYCIDALVYAPGMDKMPMFRRMEAVVSTFSTERPQR